MILIRLLLARLAFVVILAVALMAALAIAQPSQPPLLVERTTKAAAPIPDNAPTCVAPAPSTGGGDDGDDNAPAEPPPGSDIV